MEKKTKKINNTLSQYILVYQYTYDLSWFLIKMQTVFIGSLYFSIFYVY